MRFIPEFEVQTSYSPAAMIERVTEMPIAVKLALLTLTIGGFALAATGTTFVGAAVLMTGVYSVYVAYALDIL